MMPWTKIDLNRRRISSPAAKSSRHDRRLKVSPQNQHQAVKKRAESEAQWFVHTCPMCQTILRTRAVPQGVRDGVLHERVETQYLKSHGSTRLWLIGGQL